jgi:hypothetical protein
VNRCEDFPCCGHEMGCCPDFDSETGAQLNMICVCGAKLPVNARFSICAGCMVDPDDPYYGYDDEPEYDDDEHDYANYEPEEYP